MRAAEKAQAADRRVSKAQRELKKALPVIAKLNNGAHMVLVRLDVDADHDHTRVVLQDPNASDDALLVIDQVRFERVWTGNIFFFLCGLLLLWRVDRMPLDFNLFSSSWDALREWLSVVGDRLPGLRENRWLRSSTRVRKKRFSARFPLILDDMILRDFATYLAMILATFLLLALVFTFFELLTDIVRNRVSFIVLAEYLQALNAKHPAK